MSLNDPTTNELNYTILNGNIIGKDQYDIITVSNSSNNYHSLENTKIIVGGEISQITIENNENNNALNKGFTSGDKLLIGNSLSYIKLIECGNEIDDTFLNNDYNLVFYENNTIVDNNVDISLNITGVNNPVKGRLYDLKIENDGGGYGCLTEPIITIGTGAKVTTLMGVDKIIVCKEGENYSKNDNIEILSGYHPLFKDINKWCTNKPFYKT